MRCFTVVVLLPHYPRPTCPLFQLPLLVVGVAAIILDLTLLSLAHFLYSESQFLLVSLFIGLLIYPVL